MRTILTYSLLSFCGLVSGQVQVDRGMILTGPAVERNVEGLAAPVDESALITVDALASGIAHWGVAAEVNDTIVLTVTPALQAPSAGTLIRFLPLSSNTGPRWIRSGLAPARPLLTMDGAPVTPGVLLQNAPAEVVLNGTDWFLLNGNTNACPPGTLRTAGPVCMDIASTPGLLFYQAIDLCAGRGGKLCTWDEYAVGCALLETQLVGLFNEWEWIDDSSNHTHTANQAGRLSCQSQRSANVITFMTGDTRCCYRTR